MEDHNSRLGVDSEFFAQLFVIFTFYSTNLNDTVHLFCQLSVLILYVLAFLVTSLVEENDPDLFSSVELEYLLKIQFDNIRVLKQIFFLLLLSILMTLLVLSKMELEMLLAITSRLSTTTSAKELREKIFWIEATSTTLLALLLSLDSFLSMLIVDLSLLRITECFIGVGNLLELHLSSLRIFFIFVRVVFNSLFLEGLLYFVLTGTLLHTKDLIVVSVQILLT